MPLRPSLRRWHRSRARRGAERRAPAHAGTPGQRVRGDGAAAAAAIRLGLIAPGERLPPSASPRAPRGEPRYFRDAIGSLADAGWVASRRGRYGGTFVAEKLPDAKAFLPGAHEDPVELGAELEDTLALRAVIEVGTARRAAERPLSASDRERLWQAYQDCHDADPDHYRIADSRFHLLIAELPRRARGHPAHRRRAHAGQRTSTELAVHAEHRALRRPAPRDRERDPAGRTRRSRPCDGRTPRGHRGAAARLLRLSDGCRGAVWCRTAGADGRGPRGRGVREAPRPRTVATRRGRP